jgi:hypothetical protein
MMVARHCIAMQCLLGYSNFYFMVAFILMLLLTPTRKVIH